MACFTPLAPHLSARSALVGSCSAGKSTAARPTARPGLRVFAKKSDDEGEEKKKNGKEGKEKGKSATSLKTGPKYELGKFDPKKRCVRESDEEPPMGSRPCE